jgi:Tol biopolymer transport system component
VKKVPGAGAKPATSVWITDQGTTAQIYSTTDRLRLLGWSTQDKLLFESADAVIQANPQDIKILEVSLNGDAKIVTTFQNIYALSMTLSDNGNSLAFTARKDDKDTICVYSFGGSARVIAASNDPTSFFGSPTWSPDGKNIFFDKQEKINTISMFENFR